MSDAAVVLRPVLDPAKLYLGDNGACYCGSCAGTSATYTGRDLSGAPVEEVTELDQQVAVAQVGRRFACERCGRE